MLRYQDRAEAGKALANLLKPMNLPDPIVFGLARGGVAVAYEVAKVLKAPLAALVVRKIGAPWQPELALGAIADLGEMVTVFNDEIMEEVGLGRSELAEDIARETAELKRRTSLFHAVASMPDPSGRIAIVVDDGIATGATAKAALQALRKKGVKRLILAVPVAASDSVRELAKECDDIVCPMIESNLGAVGAYYRDFDQLSDEDVVALLKDASHQDFLKATRAIS